MKLNKTPAYLGLGAIALIGGALPFANAGDQTVKMCLFYDRPSGHARSDPIISQECAADHVHTFYGPRNFHPNTDYKDLITTPPKFSTSPFKENQSLYWHPSIYQVATAGDGTETFTRVSNLYSSPYYRWDTTATPRPEAFPPRFRMISANTDPGANKGGEMGANMFTECCNLPNGEEDCESWNQLFFPRKSCAFLGIAFNMPTCWNGETGDTNNHKDHMAFTLDGTVAGACPKGFNRRLPQIQIFVRIMNYKGNKYRYQLSDGNDDKWHVDFLGGWKKGKLEEIIDGCEPADPEDTGFNPPCGCTEFLTPMKKVARTMCDDDVKRLMIDEATDVTKSLPRGTCTNPNEIEKSWKKLNKKLFKCKNGGSCKEYPEDNFFLNYSKQQNCMWLKKQKKRKRKNICKKRTGTGGFDPRIVCPVTCQSCD
mmetsp:Transcript_42662/g.83878  ORF Transcript_42662/g.83878 Transcript_42662/m.83878 type:complete len:426 (-) Transcript_42662:100-1377(-)